MSNIKETDSMNVFEMLFTEKGQNHLTLLDLNNIKILNRIFKDTIFHKSFMEWVEKDPKLTPYDLELLIATFLFEYSNQEMVNDFYKSFSQYTKKFPDDKEADKFLMNIKQEIGKMLYKKLEPYAYEKNKDKYELKIDHMGMNFLFTFLDFRIYTIDKKYETSYFPRFKAFQSMFEEETQFRLHDLQLTADLIILNIYYGDSLKEMYTLGYNYISTYVCSDKNLNDMVSTLFEILQNDYSVQLEELIWKLKNFKTFEELEKIDKTEMKFLQYTLRFSKILKNECSTLLSLIKDMDRDELCGEDDSQDSDVDSVKEYRDATDLHAKVISNFYVRKRIFRHEFNSDAIIINLNLSEDTKEKIFEKFDNFSDTFSNVYKGTKSFLPYKYMFYKLLRKAGYEYEYKCSYKKFKEMETIYWSLQYPKDYQNFICFLNEAAHIVCENEYKVFDSPKKIVISEFKHSIKEAYYLLTVKDELDLVIQYFTKFLPKINKRPEYQYNFIIMEMEEEKIEITFESIFLDIVNGLNERMGLTMFMIKEEIN